MDPKLMILIFALAALALIGLLMLQVINKAAETPAPSGPARRASS